MLKAAIVTDPEGMDILVAKGRALAAESRSNLTFHQLDFPRLWWKHFNGLDGSEFGDKRGRNFLGTRSYQEQALHVAVTEGDALLGIAPLVVTRVERKGGKPPIKVLCFCADSVQVFYQDVLAHPQRREAVITAMMAALADHVAANRLLLVLGYIPDNSPNLPLLAKEIEARLAQGWKGGVAVSRTRAGAYPWNIPPLCKALAALRAKVGEADAGFAPMGALIERLQSQTSALMLFPATRVAFEKEVSALFETYGARVETQEEAARLKSALASSVIKYPYLPLPKTREEYQESLSSSKRYYFRRYLKKFQEMGGSFECIEPEKLTAADVDEYLRLHEERWGKDSIAVNAATLAFHKELSLTLAQRGVFRLYFSCWNGKRISAHVCLDVADRREYFFSGRSSDPKVEELRAGKLLVMHTILEAIDRGFTVYDFGYGGDEYKADFTRIHRTARSLFLARDEDLFDVEGLFTKYEQMSFDLAAVDAAAVGTAGAEGADAGEA
jgi:hypothetical protein